MDDGDRPHPLHALHFAAVMLIAVFAVLLFTNSRQPARQAVPQPAPATLPAAVNYVTHFPDVNAAFPVNDAENAGGIIAVDLAGGTVVDRCMTCHRFAKKSDLPDPRVPDTWKPYSADPVPEHDSWLVTGRHPGGWLNWHPPKYFGCVSCHGGNGAALDYKLAGHRSWGGRKPWQAVMTSTTEMQVRCGRCHQGDYVPGAEQVWRGRQLIESLNCSGCHDVSAQLKSGIKGPSLERIGEKLTSDFLAALPNDPLTLLGSEAMPKFRLDDKDRTLIAAYLATLKSADQPPVPEVDFTQADPAHGLELIRQARCVNCHKLPRPESYEKGDALWELPQGTMGPDLTRVSKRHGPDWTANYLADPKAWYPDTRMPEYPKLSAEDRRDIAAWLDERSQAACEVSSFITPASPDLNSLGVSQTEAVEQGRTLFVSHGCAGCHDTGDEAVQARKIGPSMINIGDKDWSLVPDEAQHLSGLHEYFSTKLSDPGFVKNALMPKFDLTDDQIADISIALLSEGAPPTPGYTVAPWETAQPALDTEGRLEAHFWDWPLAAEGSGDPHLSLTERSLKPQSCAVCHRDQYAQWLTSRHAMSMGPGMTGQMIDVIAGSPAFYHSCMRCHARLEEQQHIRAPADPADGAWEANPHFREDMYEAAHGCANCHLRGQRRYTMEKPRQDYLWDSDKIDAHPLTRTQYMQQSRFCADCHQFETDTAVAPGLPPRENTYAEWEKWYATAKEPKTCQECHMPDGDHSFKGIHDQQFVQDSVTITCSAELDGGQVKASITLENTKNGHHLPTYITPKIYFRAVQLDAAGAEIPSTFDEYMLGRYAATRPRASGNGREWFDYYDTRIPAGQSYTYEYSHPRSGSAAAVRLQIFVAPDDFYNKAYAKWIQDSNRSTQGVALLSQAYGETKPEVSGYYLENRVLDLESSNLQ